jgi:hypothetical protein
LTLANISSAWSRGRGLVAADLHAGLALLAGQGHGQLDLVGQELMQRRVSSRTGDRLAIHRLKDPDEVVALQRQQDVVGGLLLLGGVGEDHPPHRRHPLLTQEHVLGAAQTHPAPRSMALAD